MRTLIPVFLILSLLASVSWAVSRVHAPVLEVIRLSHRSRQWTKIFHGAEGWYCATDVNPMYPLTGEPAVLALFHSSPPARSGSCRTPFHAFLRQDGKTRKWTGCSDDENARRFLHALGETCGRF